MNKRLPYLVILLVCAVALAAASFVLVRQPAVAPTNGVPPASPAAVTEVRGTVTLRPLNEQYATVREGDKEWEVIVNPESTVVEAWGSTDQAMGFGDVVPGAEIVATGKVEGTIVFVATQMRIVQTPNIVILSPEEIVHNYAIVEPVFQIQGLSRTFENNVQYRVKAEEDDTVIVQGFTTATGPDVGHFALFDPVVDVKGYRGYAVLEVFEYSAKDGSVISLVSVPIKVNGDYYASAVYFSNRYKDSGALRCEETYPTYNTSRTLLIFRALTSEEIIRGNLEALLEGVTETDDEAGYFSNIPEGVVVEDVTIEGSKVRVQFNDALDRGVGGSCRVAAIRSQIVNTVKAAVKGIEEVEIAIGERVEDVLQP